MSPRFLDYSAEKGLGRVRPQAAACHARRGALESPTNAYAGRRKRSLLTW
jgi:hypothetical protein